MKNVEKAKDLLTPEQAATLAGMSRWAFMLHINAGHIKPDSESGSRKRFKRATVLRWIEERRKNGARKRGPKPNSHSKGHLNAVRS